MAGRFSCLYFFVFFVIFVSSWFEQILTLSRCTRSSFI
jgi:hypothetical protein